MLAAKRSRQFDRRGLQISFDLVSVLQADGNGDMVGQQEA